mmetsp:Transcript_3433/g.6780  ORF Transcript_3433/g.6780 Transcript_3433/m.6780 type:complete len:209 (-) Transcript_3433:1662-2288(-)
MAASPSLPCASYMSALPSRRAATSSWVRSGRIRLAILSAFTLADSASLNLPSFNAIVATLFAAFAALIACVSCMPSLSLSLSRWKAPGKGPFVMPTSASVVACIFPPPTLHLSVSTSTPLKKKERAKARSVQFIPSDTLHTRRSTSPIDMSMSAILPDSSPYPASPSAHDWERRERASSRWPLTANTRDILTRASDRLRQSQGGSKSV